jgi:hypothetical protein
MKKIIGLLIVLILVGTLLLGCTEPAPLDNNDTNTGADFTIENESDASETLNDIGTDIGGISDSLSEIDDTLTE